MTYGLVQAGEVLTSWLSQRERDGLDGRDEMWNGVLHLNPPASGNHQRLSAWLLRTLAPLADEQGLIMTLETGLFAADNDCKVPDLVAASERRWSDRGVEAPAELVVEIASPGDETLDKIEWYDAVGIEELVVLARDTLAIRHPENPLAHKLQMLPGVLLVGDGGIEVHRGDGHVRFVGRDQRG